jgi:diguanylate cyclase (GGDEF)-like protein/PAS domain S-box-containing protein
MSDGPANVERLALGAALEAMPIGIAATRSGKIDYANRHLCRVLGLTAEELSGLDIAQFRSGAPARLRVEIRSAVEAGDTWQGETALETRDGPRHMLESCYPEQGPGGGVVRVLHFFHELSVLQTAGTLSRHVLRDRVTGLPSRGLFDEALRAHIAAALRERTVLAVLYTDVEQFNCVNLVLDRDAGDALLRLIAERIRLSLRQSDVLARVGGDEFAIIVPRVTDPATITMAEKLRRACSGWYEAHGKQHSVRLSVGTSVYPADGDTVEELLRTAEASMYRIKAAGRQLYPLLAPGVGTRYALDE